MWVLLLREVAVPWGEIERVEVGLPSLPRFHFRIGQYIPKRSIRGRFKAKGLWYFVDADVRRRDQVVVLARCPARTSRSSQSRRTIRTDWRRRLQLDSDHPVDDADGIGRDRLGRRQRERVARADVEVGAVAGADDDAGLRVELALAERAVVVEQRSSSA